MASNVSVTSYYKPIVRKLVEPLITSSNYAMSSNVLSIKRVRFNKATLFITIGAELDAAMMNRLDRHALDEQKNKERQNIINVVTQVLAESNILLG